MHSFEYINRVARELAALTRPSAHSPRLRRVHYKIHDCLNHQNSKEDDGRGGGAVFGHYGYNGQDGEDDQAESVEPETIRTKT